MCLFSVCAKFDDFFHFESHLTSQLRFADEMVSRTQPPPNLSDGPYDKLSGKSKYIFQFNISSLINVWNVWRTTTLMHAKK